MIVVVQCAARKREEAGFMRTTDGGPVLFVADPSSAPISSTHRYARPDDIRLNGQSWRDLLLEYNLQTGENPLKLLRAIDLYSNPTYLRLASEVGITKTYVLSAGWGLIRSDFLTPDYDITFSASAEPYKRRKKTDVYRDFRMVPSDTDAPIIFFGGKDYVPLFCDLTQSVRTRRTVFYNSDRAPDAPGCSLVRFKTSTRTNWHYECANAFLAGDLPLSPDNER